MKKNFTIKNFEAIVIGAGGAGLMTAISASDCGLKNIAVITFSERMDCIRTLRVQQRLYPASLVPGRDG